MKLRRVLHLSWTGIKARRMRASLTALGIIIGITAIVSISALGAGFQQEITDQLGTGIETDLITVMPGGGEFMSSGGLKYLSEYDADYIEANVTSVTAALPQMEQIAEIYGQNNESAESFTIGVDFAKFWQIYNDSLNFASGGLPSPGENTTCVLGAMVLPNASMGDEVIIGVTVRVNSTFVSTNYTLTVSGILEAEGASGTFGIFSRDMCCFFPIDTCKEFLSNEEITSIVVKISDPNLARAAADEILDYYENQVEVLIPSDLIETISGALDMIQVFLTAIGSIALLVAGISILNIMLVSVMERTHEIGIMKAIGAKSRTVMVQFLSEAALLGFVGGSLGIVFGWMLSIGMGLLIGDVLSGVGNSNSGGPSFGSIEIIPILTPEMIPLAFAFAIIVSVVFALYPAWKASKLDPIRALRYE